MIDIDGSRGEGGGQILRTSLALSMLTGQPLRMRHLRAGRAKPGLRRQHLACVEAAALLCRAELRGAEVSSQSLDFTPHTITGGTLDIDIGTAGSTTLVIQTILVPALAANISLRATIQGGTHNPLAPTFDFLDRVYLPHLRAMGASCTLTLDRHGFATGGRADKPAANGQVTLTVAPSTLRPISLLDAGEITARSATAILSRLPTHVADREHGIVRERLGWSPSDCHVREVTDAGGTANVLVLEVERAGSPVPARELVSSIGAQGLRAETVAHRACDDLAAFLAANVPVGEHLADQLLLPLAVAGAGAFRAAPLSLHATTNIETIGHFLDVPITVTPSDASSILVTVG